MTAFTPRRTAATWAALGAACLGLATAPASAMQLGQVDSFAAGLLAAGLAGWRAWHFVRFAAVNPSVRPANRSEAMHHRLIRTAVATGLSAPDYATFAPGDASRLYVVEQNGLLRVLRNGVLESAAALDMRSLVAPPLVPTNANDERGCLGLAFHPGFANPTWCARRMATASATPTASPSTAPTWAATAT